MTGRLRLRRHAGAEVGAGASVASTADRPPVSCPTVHWAFVAHAETLRTEPAPPAVLGIDETRRGRPRWTRGQAGNWLRLERFETNFVDLAGAGGLLGQTAGRTGAAVVAWLDARGEPWKAAVQVVAMDPHAGYRAAVAEALPHARVVVDQFHLVRLANLMVTDVRQRVAREQLGRRGRLADPAWAHRRLLLRAGDRLSPRALSRLGEVAGARRPEQRDSAPPGASRSCCASCWPLVTGPPSRIGCTGSMRRSCAPTGGHPAGP